MLQISGPNVNGKKLDRNKSQSLNNKNTVSSHLIFFFHTNSHINIYLHIYSLVLN